MNINTGETQGEAVADLSDCSIDGIFDAASGGGLYQYKKSTDERLNQLFSLLDQVAKAGQNDDRSTSFLMDMYSMSNGHYWHPTTMREGNDAFAMRVKVVGAASDPLVGSAANIDYKLIFIVGSDPKNSRVLVGVFGLLDGFPAFEAYATYNNTTKALFQVGVPTGHTPFDLLGDADATIVGAVTF